MTEKAAVSIYEKLANARHDFHQLELKKSGHNKFQDYKYFELADFIKPGLKCLRDNKLIALVSFTDEVATMKVHDFENSDPLVFTSPMSHATMKGCQPVQNVGGCETFQRRYLWTMCLDIIEQDAIEARDQREKMPEAKPAPKKAKPLVKDDAPDDIPASFTQMKALESLAKIDKRRESWLETNKEGMTHKRAQNAIDNWTMDE